MVFVPNPTPAKKTIKLALENNEKEGPFVRIEVPRDVGPQLLKMLRRRSLDLWRIHNAAAEQNLEGARTFLTYRDVENDRCFILSEEDLRCALLLYPTTPLRVIARVELPTLSPPAATNRNTSTQTNQERSDSDTPVHKVLEAVAKVLNTTAARLQEQGQGNPPTTVKKGAAAVAAPVVAVAPSVVAVAPSVVAVAPPAVVSAPPPVVAASPDQAISHQAPLVAAPAPVEEEIPFIHGRHTCDGCLTTPIVGKRYHAANLPDYDLCAGCRDNYMGSEVKFEEAELDRDRPFQERWRRRIGKLEKEQEKKKKEQERKAKRMAVRNGTDTQPIVSTVPRRCGGSRHWNHSNNAIHCRVPIPAPFAGKTSAPSEQVEEQFGGALQEAIRRSLLDLPAVTKVDAEENVLFSEPTEAAAPSFEEPMLCGAEPSAVKEVAVSAPEEEFVIPVAPVGAHPASSKETSKSPATETEDSFTWDAEGNGDVAAALGETMDAIANAINDFNAELVRNSSKNDDDTYETNSCDNQDDVTQTSDVDIVVVGSASESKEVAAVMQVDDESKEVAAVLQVLQVDDEDKKADITQYNNTADVRNGIESDQVSEVNSRSNTSVVSVPMPGSDYPTPSLFPSKSVASAASAADSSVAPEEEYPFIHGRHTCDGCLTTPIVGKRYHAVNRNDFDLCAGCRDSLKGGDIVFEVAELDRDRPFQERWRRRFGKLEKELEKQKNEQERKTESVVAHSGVDPQLPVLSPTPHLGGDSRTTFAMSSAPFEQVDHALEEAIRQSMLDIRPTDKKENTKEENREEFVTVTAFEEEELVIPPAAPVGAHPALNNEESKPARKETEDSFTFEAEGNGDVAAELGETMDAIANAISDVNAELVGNSSNNPSEQVDHALQEAIRRSMLDTQETHKINNKEEKVLLAEPSFESFEEVSHPKLSSEIDLTVSAPEEENFSIPPVAPVGAHPAFKNEEIKSPAKENDDSFSFEAEGHGDVAAALGETMDAIANAINDISAELAGDSGYKDEGSQSSDVDIVMVDSADESKEGTTILQGDEQDKEDDISQGSWDTVGDRSGFNDEALARAAQVIGSALFESEIKSQGHATNASFPMLGSEHSIPSILPSLESESYGQPQPAQMQRWAVQLEKLHELGFDNDSDTVEIMERLQAANIGSGETDEISVERVVNELMRYW